MPRSLIVVLSAALLLGSGSVRAQEGQSCGGLLCDIGVFGHKTSPAPPPATPVVATPEPSPQQERTAAIGPPPVIAPAPVAERPARKAPKKKRIAKAAPKAPAAKAAIAPTTSPAAATPAIAPIGGASGEAPASPADMFQPIYR